MPSRIAFSAAMETNHCMNLLYSIRDCCDCSQFHW